MTTAALYVLWMCLGSCIDIQKSRVVTGLTAAQCASALTLHEQVKLYDAERLVQLGIANLLEYKRQHSSFCIAPDGEIYSSGYVERDQTNKYVVKNSDADTLMQTGLRQGK